MLTFQLHWMKFHILKQGYIIFPNIIDIFGKLGKMFDYQVKSFFIKSYWYIYGVPLVSSQYSIWPSLLSCECLRIFTFSEDGLF